MHISIAIICNYPQLQMTAVSERCISDFDSVKNRWVALHMPSAVFCHLPKERFVC